MNKNLLQVFDLLVSSDKLLIYFYLFISTFTVLILTTALFHILNHKRSIIIKI